MPPFLIQDPSRVGRLRRRLRLIPGVRQPAAPPADAGLLQARRSRHLVRADGSTGWVSACYARLEALGVVAARPRVVAAQAAERTTTASHRQSWQRGVHPDTRVVCRYCLSPANIVRLVIAPGIRCHRGRSSGGASGS
jgi:hypothetical protein